MSKKKINTKLFSKITLSLFGAAAIITPIAYFATARGYLPLLTAAGSSSVFPLMKEFAEEYNDADITVQAGGSGVGIQAALKGNKNFGMASKDPKGDFDKNLADWTEREIKTVTVAWDGMGLVYRDDPKATPINLTTETMPFVYKAFVGKESVSYSDLGLEGNNTQVAPFARTGGSDASGTADAFLKESKLVSGADKIYTELKSGTYGPLTKETPESNAQSLQQVLASNDPGAMVYLSAGFIMNNREELTAKGFNVATYNGVEIGTIDANEITTGYNWYRPLNVLFSRQDPLIEGVDNFVAWMVGLDNNGNFMEESRSKEIIIEQGYIALTLPQKETMKNEDGFFAALDAILGRTGATSGEDSTSKIGVFNYNEFKFETFKSKNLVFWDSKNSNLNKTYNYMER